MPALVQNDAYTPSQVSAVTGLPLPAVHKAIEHKLIRPKRVRSGHVVQRLLSRSQVLYLVLEARGLRSLPLTTRRQVARAVEQDPGIDAMTISEGSVVVIEFKSARKAVEAGFRRLVEAERMVVSDPDIMGGAQVYRGQGFRSMRSPICCPKIRPWKRFLKAIRPSVVKGSSWHQCTPRHFRVGGAPS